MSDDRKLLIRRAGSAWIEPESSAYDNESHLQEILATDPAQIPGVDTGSLTATELLTGGGTSTCAWSAATVRSRWLSASSRQMATAAAW